MSAKDGLTVQVRLAGLVVGGLLAGSLGGAAAQAATAGNADVDGEGPSEPDVAEGRGSLGDMVRLAASEVRGTFQFVQDTVDSNETVRAAFMKADASLCHLPGVQDGISAQPGRVTVGGSSVSSAVEATLDELKAACGQSTRVLTCACTANPAGGSSIATAEVGGVSLADLAVRSGIDTSCFGSAWEEMKA